MVGTGVVLLANSINLKNKIPLVDPCRYVQAHRKPRRNNEAIVQRGVPGAVIVRPSETLASSFSGVLFLTTESG